MRMEISDTRRARLRQWFMDRPVPEKEKSYLSQLMGGKASFGERAARRLEGTYGMGTRFLDIPLSEAAPESVALPKGYIRFELIDVQAAAGNGASVIEYPEVIRYVNVLESWALTTLGSDLTNIKLITARGTSMQGTIENGDVLFVDCTVRAYDGDGIYVIAGSDGLQVKRLQKMQGDVLAVISDNKLFDSERFAGEAANKVVVCGRILAAWSLKRFW